MATKKQERTKWAIKQFRLATILYYTRRKDYLLVLRAKAPGPFTARWYSGHGWGFIGYGYE